MGQTERQKGRAEEKRARFWQAHIKVPLRILVFIFKTKGKLFIGIRHPMTD